MTSCNGTSPKFLFPSGAFSPPTSIYEKLQEVGITLDESKSVYPYFCTFDAEVYISSSKTELPKNSSTITWSAKHHLASVSVCSNVAGYTKPQCFVNETGDEQDVVNRMMSYIEDISFTCKKDYLQGIKMFLTS